MTASKHIVLLSSLCLSTLLLPASCAGTHRKDVSLAPLSCAFVVKQPSYRRSAAKHTWTQLNNRRILFQEKKSIHSNLQQKKSQHKAVGNMNIALSKTIAKASTLSMATNSNELETTQQSLWTFEDLDKFAEQEGVSLSISTLGPGFRTVARSTHNASSILGYCEGFVRPSGDILHLDKMEVFKTMVQKCKRDNPKFRGGGTTFGVGLLFGYQALLHGVEKGCTIAEFLAIDDEDFQHKRLVRYYSRAGFDIIKYVGDDFQDIPARMVWGGCGTLMRARIDKLLPFWTSLLQRAADKEDKDDES